MAKDSIILGLWTEERELMNETGLEHSESSVDHKGKGGPEAEGRPLQKEEAHGHLNADDQSNKRNRGKWPPDITA